jgi:hypothetical protein
MGIEAPHTFRMSFDESDEKYMQIFNNQAGLFYKMLSFWQR